LALGVDQRHARLDPLLDQGPDDIELAKPRIPRRHLGVVGGLGFLDRLAGLGDAGLAGADDRRELGHSRGVERALDLHLVLDLGIGRGGVGGLAARDLGRQARDLDRQGVDRGLAAAKLASALGPVEADQLLAALDRLADLDQDRLDDPAFEVGDHLKVRAGDDPAHALDGSVELGQRRPGEEGDEEDRHHPEQDVGRGARPDPAGEILDMGVVDVHRLRPPLAPGSAAG
jgi:hypothetical protein